jgi:hypothetical protein
MSKVGITESEFTFETVTQKFQGQRWTVEYTLVPMARAKATVWTAWLASLNGRQQTFLSPLSNVTTSQGGASASVAGGSSDPLVNGAGQTGNTLAIDGAGSNVTNYLKAGDYIQLGDNDTTARIYMVLQDASSDGDGEITLDIWPDLYSSPDNDTQVTVTNPRGLFKLVDNRNQYVINNARSFVQLRFSAFGVI